MSDETEDIPPAEQARRDRYTAGVRKTIQGLMPWMRKNLELILSWYEVFKDYESREAIELFRRFYRSQGWADFKPVARDFFLWDRDRKEYAEYDKESRTAQHFGTHNEIEGALVIFEKFDHGKKLLRFGRLQINERDSEQARMWFPVKESHRKWMDERIWHQMIQTPDTVYQKTDWRVLLPGGDAPESWGQKPPPVVDGWPERLQDFYELYEAEAPAEVMQ